MGVIIPQVITSDRATGAQVIDGSLKFNEDNKTVLERTNTRSAANDAASVSVWVKRSTLSSSALYTLLQYESGGTFAFGLTFYNDYMYAYDNTTQDADAARSDGLLRDVNSWYHIFYSRSNGEANGTLYINGVEQSKKNSVNTLTDWFAYEGQIGYRKNGTQRYYDGFMSQMYVIDGQQLSPNDFGFTDPLTDTWRPKKYEGTFGTTGFYLPMDGNSPIGQDKSGNGNDWTPANFGGSVALDNPIVSGARPILNTLPGGTQAGVGVFGSKQNVGYAVTYYDDGGGNKYYIDGVKQATLNGLIRGATYTFDTVALGSTHPFRFSETDGGSEYTNGVAAITGTATTITIPYDAPETLYYYCTAHSGMGSSITGITTNEKLADQYASNCTLALPLVGSKDDVSTSIACTSSLKSGTLTTASIVTTNSNFYSGSLNMGGGRYDITDSTEFNFGSGSYTVECWVYVTSGGTAGSAFIGKWYAGSQGTTNSYLFYRNTSGELHWIVSSNGTNGTSYNAGAIPLNKWTHCAVSYDSSSDILTLFIDGVCVKRVSSPASPATVSRSLTLGRWDIGDGTWSGQMSDVRIYKGVAKYTASAEGNQGFIPTSTNPDILPDTPSGVSGGSKLAKITEGAVNIVKASTSYLDVSASSDFRLDGEFCIEYFVKLKDFSNDSVYARTFVLDGATGDGGSNNIHLNVNPSTGNVLFWNGSSQRIAGTIPISGGWHHVALTRDSSNDIRLFVDGRISGTDSNNTTDFNPNSGSPRPRLGGLITGNNGRVDGTFSNWRIVKGSAIYTSNFTPPTAPLTNVTNTKLLCCQSNTSATEAAVTPGSITANGDAAATNFNPFNTDINTVRGQETGYATWNPLKKGTSDVSMSEGNLFWRTTSNGPDKCTYSTVGMDSGKFYWENEIVEATATAVGIANALANQDGGPALAHNWMYYSATGQTYIDGSASSYGDAYNTNGTIIGVAFDRDNLTLEFYKNGVSQGKLTSISGLTDSETYFAMCGDSGGSSQSQVRVNFGQKPFKFPPPDGFQPLNAANVRPETVISRPDQYVGITTWKGDDQASHIINDLNFDGVPDFVWIKRRDGNSMQHQLYDTIRGATKPLVSSATSSEDTQTSGLKAFVRNGFELGASSVVNGLDGDNGNVPFNYVAWCWKAGGNKNTFNVDDVGYASAAAAGLDGGLTVTGASVGTKQGFSIIKATGSNSQNSFKHGLGKVPKFVIAKDMDNSRAWYIYHGSLGEDYRASFDDVTFTSDSGYFGSGMTDTLVTLKSGGSGGNNYNGADMIYYIWADVSGLQKFGKYIGNNTAAPNGPFVELGFRPALVVIKRVGTGNWIVYDNKRDTFNPLNGRLYWNTNSANVDNSGYDIDFLSNGFRITGGTNDNYNAASDYVYAAWAEAPTVNLYGGGANAR